MTDPFMVMLTWPASTDTGTENDWEAIRERREQEERDEGVEVTARDWEEFWQTV
jgi:hypothetical protein